MSHASGEAEMGRERRGRSTSATPPRWDCSAREGASGREAGQARWVVVVEAWRKSGWTQVAFAEAGGRGWTPCVRGVGGWVMTRGGGLVLRFAGDGALGTDVKDVNARIEAMEPRIFGKKSERMKSKERALRKGEVA